MTTLRFVDAAYPSGISGGPYDGVAFYIGGDTPHVWAPAEIHARPERYRLPIWVRSNPASASPSGDVREALAQLTALGAPKGCLVAWDSETSVDPSYIQSAYAVLAQGGYKMLDYGSASTVYGNKNPDGYYWAADWTNSPHVDASSVITQYQDFGPFDESEAKSGLPFWDTRPGTPKPPPAKKEVDVPSGQLESMAFIPFKKGEYTEVLLLRDFIDTANPVTVRVAEHSSAKGWSARQIHLTESIPYSTTFAENDIDGVSLVLESAGAPVGYELA